MKDRAAKDGIFELEWIRPCRSAWNCGSRRWVEHKSFECIPKEPTKKAAQAGLRAPHVLHWCR